MSRIVVSIVIGASICYGLITIWMMATSPELGFVCRLHPLTPAPDGVAGVPVVRMHEEPADSLLPKNGDWLCELNGRPIRTFYDFSTELASLRSQELQLYSDLSGGGTPDDVPRTSNFTLGQRDGRQEVRIWYRPADNPRVLKSAWVPLRRQSLSMLVLPVLWFASQLMILVTCGVAYWNQPNDRTLRVFLLLCCAALVAYIGGSRWWLISGTSSLTIPFIFAATLLPAALLHFLLLYPRPHRWMERFPQFLLAAIYTIPMVFCALRRADMDWLEVHVGGKVGHRAVRGVSRHSERCRQLVRRANQHTGAGVYLAGGGVVYHGADGPHSAGPPEAYNPRVRSIPLDDLGRDIDGLSVDFADPHVS